LALFAPILFYLRVLADLNQIILRLKQKCHFEQRYKKSHLLGGFTGAKKMS